jgi:hypothetical protein
MSQRTNPWGVYFFEKLITLMLLLVAINFFIILTKGSYSFIGGPLQVSVQQFNGSLLVLISLAIVIFWLHEKQRGLPACLRLRSPWLLFLTVVFIYSLNGTTLGAGDTIPASYLPISILRQLDFDLNEFPFLYDPKIPYFLQRINGQIVSTYPPWAGLLAVPIYLFPVLGGVSPQSPLIPALEKLSATLITALSVMFLLFALRRITSEKIAWLIAIIYAFGTSSFSTSSQALWQHGSSQLFLTLTLYWLMKGMEKPRLTAFAGFALASAIICRPTNILVAIPIAGYILLKRRDQLVGFLLASMPPVLLLGAYNTLYLGSPFRLAFAATAIGPSGFLEIALPLLGKPLTEGLVGVLGSPSRGLLIYSPILLFSFLGMAMIWKTSKQVLLKCLCLAPLLIILLTSKWEIWWGGWCYGPRLLADITPILCLYLYLPLEWASSIPFMKWVMAGLTAFSIGLHALGVFGVGNWNSYPDVDRHPERLWSWADSPPMYFGKNMVTSALRELRRVVTAIPDSRNAPQNLKTSYDLVRLAPGLNVPQNASLTVHIQVVNRGEAIWLAHTREDRGAVRLGWRWLRSEDGIPLKEEGRAPLQYDVFPGQLYLFQTTIQTPPEPGRYTLELGLVSELVTWFSEHGDPPLRFDVRVHPTESHAAP